MPAARPTQALISRRAALGGAMAAMAAAGWLPTSARAAWNEAAFAATDLPSALKALGPWAPQASPELSLLAPDVAENGASVAIGLSCSLAGVRRLLLAVDRNPHVLAADVELSEWVEPALSLRLKLAETSRVTGLALLADGRVLLAQREVQVLLGSCGD